MYSKEEFELELEFRLNEFYHKNIVPLEKEIMRLGGELPQPEEDYIGYARKLKEKGKTLREIEEKLREEGYEVSKSSLQRKI